MHRLLAAVLSVALLLLPLQAVAAAKMEADVPVWTEEAVRQYLRSYAEGKEMDRLYSYYDIQIRRYMPPSTFESMLAELAWLTGDFLALGAYTTFAEEERGTRTHVVHLHMQKQDLDAYFTHRDAPDDWEVLSLEFVPAAKQEVDLGFVVGASEDDLLPYREYAAVVGEGGGYPLPAVITLPARSPESELTAGCVLVHDAGALDRDASLGETKFFRDLARELAKAGIASIRYDKRTFAYTDFVPETVYDETVADALLAMELLASNTAVPKGSIILVGHGLGGTLLPRIAAKAQDLPAGMLLIGSSTVPYARQLLYAADMSAMPQQEADALEELVRNVSALTPEQAKELELFGRSAYYFWDLEQSDPVRLIKQLEIPVCIVQGRNDASVSEEEGWSAYAEALENCSFATFRCYRGLNHLLAKDLSTDEAGQQTYTFDAGIDVPAVRDMAEWILSVVPQVQTMEVEQ